MLEKEGSTGIAILDELLGGGFPKGSVVLLAGSAGTGKTIFASQWLFAGAQSGENGVYITLTEPLFKYLANVEHHSFYRREFIEHEKIMLLDIRKKLTSFKESEILGAIAQIIHKTKAKRLCIDSITAIAYHIQDKARIRKFIFDLGQLLATLGCTTILTSEVTSTDVYSVYGVEEFIADAILSVSRIHTNDRIVRTLRVVKMRGKEHHTEPVVFNITPAGIELFPRFNQFREVKATSEKISTGQKVLDRILSGGVFKTGSTLIAGPTGTGKSILGFHFLLDGLRNKEHGLIVSFEESEAEIFRNAHHCNVSLEKYVGNKSLFTLCFRSSVNLLDEIFVRIRDLVHSKRITRCVIDAIPSAIPFFGEENVVTFVKQLHVALKSLGVSCYFITDAYSVTGSIPVLTQEISRSVDNVIMLRSVEMNSELHPILNVVKTRGSSHLKQFRKCRITSNGFVIGEPLEGYEGVITGVGRKISSTTYDRLETLFRKFIGPVGLAELERLSRSGVSSEKLVEYVDSLATQGVMESETALQFKEEINTLFGSGGKS